MNVVGGVLGDVVGLWEDGDVIGLSLFCELARGEIMEVDVGEVIGEWEDNKGCDELGCFGDAISTGRGFSEEFILSGVTVAEDEMDNVDPDVFGSSGLRRDLLKEDESVTSFRWASIEDLSCCCLPCLSTWRLDCDREESVEPSKRAWYLCLILTVLEFELGKPELNDVVWLASFTFGNPSTLPCCCRKFSGFTKSVLEGEGWCIDCAELAVLSPSSWSSLSNLFRISSTGCDMYGF